MSSAFVDPTTPTIEALTKLSNLHPELSTQYAKISELFSLKHWHQLTQAILSFLSDKPTTLKSITPGTSLFDNGDDISNTHQALYEKVVLKCDTKLNPQSLAIMASMVAETFEGAAQACQLLQQLLDTKQDQLETAGTLYTRSKLILWKLQFLANLSADSKEFLELKHKITSFLREGAATLKLMEDSAEHGGDTSVHSAYYEASKAYYKLMGPPDLFFKEGMSFLNYTPMTVLTSQELYELATDLSLAALTGEGVFHFGSVVHDTPILQSLENTENEWLLGWMKCMANGDVEQFHAISTQHAAQIAQHPVLVSRGDIVQEKITLLALVDLIFKRPSAERTLEFTDIASQIGVDVDKVEWVIMKALSLGLMKGSMDQVDGTVNVTWVMPRVLNDTQLQGLATRFGEWAVKVSKERDYMAEQTIFA